MVTLKMFDRLLMFSRQGSELSPSQFLTVATLTPVLRANSFCESLCCVRSWAIFLPIMESPPSQFRIRQRARKRVVIIGLKLLPLPIPGRNGCLLMSKRNSSPSARGQARRSTAADFRPSERWMEEGRRGERLSTAKSCAPCAGQKTSPRRACPSAETSACATCGAWKRGTAIHPVSKMYGISRALGTTIEDLLLPPEEEDPS